MYKLREESLQHLEIAEYLIKNIRSGKYEVNEKIPSENELCRQFQVNRHIVRQAIARITNLDGLHHYKGRVVMLITLQNLFNMFSHQKPVFQRIWRKVE